MLLRAVPLCGDHACLCVCTSICAVRACVRACACACMCVRVRARMSTIHTHTHTQTRTHTVLHAQTHGGQRNRARSLSTDQGLPVACSNQEGCQRGLYTHLCAARARGRGWGGGEVGSLSLSPSLPPFLSPLSHTTVWRQVMKSKARNVTEEVVRVKKNIHCKY